MNKTQAIQTIVNSGDLFAIDPIWLRRQWFVSAKKTSVGILLFSFNTQAWDFPETLGSWLKRHPRAKKRLLKWIKTDKSGPPYLPSTDELAWLIRP